MWMSRTEKITVNLNVVDLGKVDLLVDQGLYSNRTDLIKTAIRNQIAEHSQIVDQVVTESAYSIGIRWFDKKELEKVLAENKKLNITQIGMLSLAEDVDSELALKTINSINIKGVFRANDDVVAALKNRIN